MVEMLGDRLKDLPTFRKQNKYPNCPCPHNAPSNSSSFMAYFLPQSIKNLLAIAIGLKAFFLPVSYPRPVLQDFVG